MLKQTIYVIILISIKNHLVQSQLLEGIYCGKLNCYDILGVTKEATKSEIARNYRQLARQHHPDKFTNSKDKQEAEQKFTVIANAYEILKDEELRSDYNYMLENPDQYYAHYYRYYRRRMAPKVDVRIVIVVTITIISAIQYYSGWQRYDTAINYFMTVPKYRNRALDIATQNGLLSENRKGKSKGKVPKQETDRIIKKVIEEKMDIKGAYAKPQITDVLWVQLVILPYTIWKYIYWNLAWFWNHTLLKKPYNREEKLYIIRRYLKMGKHQFDAQEDEKKEEFLARELWIWDNFEQWKKDEEENVKKQLAESNKYKQYRRYLKNHGVGRMTFDDS